MNHGLDYLAHLARESARFADALRATPPDVSVPSCPDWNADDLLWHLGKVQWFWGTIVGEGVLDSARAQELDREPTRPTGRRELEAFFARASQDLHGVLSAAPPDTPAWTWSREQTVGFIRRRQAHEALIHRVDAELTAGRRIEMDPALSADGVDEVLRIMYGAEVPWGRFTEDPAKTLRLIAADTGDTWYLVLGWFVGTDPDTGKSYDEIYMRPAEVDPGNDAAASATGSAQDLDCWLWRRPPVGQVEFSGDAEVVTGFETLISPGID